MPRCAQCGVNNLDESNDGHCLHHGVGDRDWALVNRMFCDLVHRGIEPPAEMRERFAPPSWQIEIEGAVSALPGVTATSAVLGGTEVPPERLPDEVVDAACS